MSQYSRQARNEKLWAKHFHSFLSKEYVRAARKYPEEYEPDDQELTKLMTDLHKGIILTEARITYEEHVAPYEPERLKDIIDMLANVFRGGGLINFWQNLVGEYLQARIATKISSIADTTRQRIMEVIERGLNDGEGPEAIARRIRAEGRTSVNLNRSRAIARTETMSAMNQGTLLAARSSNLQMEKKWDATIDGRTRLAHEHADVWGDWIDIDALFWVANRHGSLESADGPGDANLSPENSVNCRCGLMIRVKRDANGNIIRK